ncbi:MBL fold metallo-hydrolase [Dactylosporangium sp. CA-052675]|uniref:MBL fold metallo-hydrolase n=1 Tax=Dactylosporangium sp. CA-052675 TaxID=3239927 RepID=UPI003D90AD3F
MRAGSAARRPGVRIGRTLPGGRRGLREIPERLSVGTALVHLGGVRFPISGPLRYTMTARDAVELCAALRPATVIPVHYEGWQHFREGRAAAERVLTGPVRWLQLGVPADVEA